MSRRFQTSKYKNANPTQKAQSGPWVRGLTVGSYSGYGNFVKSSAAFAAFNINPTGSQLGVVSLDSSITGFSRVPILNAHSDLVTDIDFSPFEDGLLATGSADSTVKIWSLSESSLTTLATLSPELVASSTNQRVETVSFSPTAEYLLAYSSGNVLTLMDILYNKPLHQCDDLHDDTIMSFDWSYNGALAATCSKDKQLRILDFRANQNQVVSSVNIDNDKDARVLFLGDTPLILTTGYDASRMRKIFIRDTRNLSEEHSVISLDTTAGSLIPLFDPDTNMLFFAGRGDNTIHYYEMLDNTFMERTRFSGDQTKGVCLVPKRALKVMETEANRILLLTGNALQPISYNVPRKSYMDFHKDLFPETRGTTTTGFASAWMGGSNGIVSKTSLDPSSYSPGSLVVLKKTDLFSRRAEEESRVSQASAAVDEAENYKKSVPEARPRKKSLSSSGSSSDEVNEAVGSNARPIPRPRVNSNGSNIPVLRTPSSFLTRRVADFSRGNSTEEMSGLPSYAAALEIEKNANSANNNPLGSDSEDQIDGHFNGSGENGHSEINNGNHDVAEDKPDGQSMSTSDRRKLFEARLESSNTNGASTEAANDQAKQKLSVADRLKMFQPKASDDSVPESEPHTEVETEAPRKVSESESESPVVPESKAPEKEVSHSAPFVKPERKITPPSVKTGEAPAQPKPSGKRIDTVFGQVSKYRNFKAVPLHKKFHIENLRNISTTCPSESELIQANPERVAVPLNTPGGKIAIFELSKGGRYPDGVIPALVHGTKVMDFMWDPFDSTRLIVGCDDGRICLWIIPEGGLKEQTNEPEFAIYAHSEKVYFVKFHPLAKDVLATGSYDLTIRLWDLKEQKEMMYIQLEPEQVQTFSFAWSPCGSKFATASKDGKIRVYEPRLQTKPILEGKGPAGVRGGRVSWVLDGKFLVVAGFDRSSERQLLMYNCADLSKVCTVSLDVSPAILVPFYDEDSSILLLSGRGDSTIFAFDVVEEQPFLKQLSHHRCPGAHQGVSFLMKNACEVQNVEFAKALRLTEYAVEPWSFTVPRVKSEFFQDDLFPATKCLWEPTMTSEEWFDGMNKEPKRINLKPPNMKSLGEISGSGANRGDAGDTKAGKTPAVVPSISPQTVTSGPVDKSGVKKQQEMLEDAIKSKLEMNMKLEQDSMEGVDESEWTE